MEIVQSNISINQNNGLSLWQPCKKVVKELSSKTAYEQYRTSVLLMYPRKFETILHLSYQEILLWLVESDANQEADIVKLDLYKLTVTSAPTYMHDDENYVKYWIENNERHYRLTGFNNWELIQSEDGDIILLYKLETTSVIHAKVLTHQCMIDFKA